MIVQILGERTLKRVFGKADRPAVQGIVFAAVFVQLANLLAHAESEVRPNGHETGIEECV
jgi:hypothetical protein